MERESNIPFYYQIAETIKARIESKEYKPDDIIPSEKELGRAFHVSNITIRKAMGLLVEWHLVIRRRGVGTRVIRKEEKRIPLKITGNFRDWIDSAIGDKKILDVEVIEIGNVESPDAVAKTLQIPSDTRIWRMKRVRKLDKNPYSYCINHVPFFFMKNIDPDQFSQASFLEVFQSYSGLKITKIEQNVEATTADMDVSSILDIEFGAPLFFVENIYYTADFKPVEVTHMYFRGDRYIYKSNIMLFDRK